MRKIISILMVLLIIFSLTGSIEGDVNVQVSEDTIEEYVIEVTIPNEVIEMEEKEGFEVFSFNSSESEFNDRISTLDYESKNISRINTNNSTIYRLELEDVSAKESVLENESQSPALKHTRYNNGTVVFRQLLRPMTKENDFRVISNLEAAYAYNVNLNYQVETSYPVVETNGEMVNNQTVEWSFNQSNIENELYLRMDGPERSIVEKVTRSDSFKTLMLIMFFLVSFTLMALVCYRIVRFIGEEF